MTIFTHYTPLSNTCELSDIQQKQSDILNPDFKQTTNNQFTNLLVTFFQYW